jgi:diguanylate cyclase (GGDEF)-like protein
VFAWLEKHILFSDLDRDILTDIQDQAFRKLHLLSSLGMAFSLLFCAVFFWYGKADGEVQETWRYLVMTIDLWLSLLLFFVSAFSIWVSRHMGEEGRPYRKILEFVLVFAIMLGCILLATVDQLVTTSITPYLLFCVMAGLLFPIRPVISIPGFAFSYLFFYVMVDSYQASAAVNLTNRLNGLIAVLIGIYLSVSIWNGSVQRSSQSKYISLQQHELKRINDQLGVLASSDGLTGLQNRRMLDNVLEETLEQCSSSKSPFSIILFDIDRFKEFNDYYGHVQGDDCLKMIANLLLDSLQFGPEKVYRYGGEEFVLLLPGLGSEQAFEVAERVRKGVLQLRIPHRGNVTSIYVSASFGVLTLTDTAQASPTEVLDRVDALLYRAKARGRNCSVQESA